jgi:acetyl esterase/lipase
MKILFLSCLFFAVVSECVAKPERFPLWPDGVPGQLARISQATMKLRDSYGVNPSRLTDIFTPEMDVYHASKPNGTCVVVAPGGGYMFLSAQSEGTQVCEWLTGIGVTAVLLKYRTPTRDEALPHEKPVADALRAIGMVRHHAKEWGLDPKRIGLLGFSAGGNLLGHAAWDRGERSYPVNPEFDDSRGPDFGVFVYGGGFLDKQDPQKFKDGFNVPSDAPPMFFIVAHDDKTNPVEAARLYLEYKRLGIPSELHIFTHGGHGFGMRPGDKPVHSWPKRCSEWFEAMGFLQPLQ